MKTLHLLNNKIKIMFDNLATSENRVLDIIKEEHLLFIIYNAIVDSDVHYEKSDNLSLQLVRFKLDKILTKVDEVELSWLRNQNPDIKIKYKKNIFELEHTSIYCDKLNKNNGSEQAQFLFDDKNDKKNGSLNISDNYYLSNLERALKEKKRKFINHKFPKKITLFINVQYLIMYWGILENKTIDTTFKNWLKITLLQLNKVNKKEELWRYFNEVIILGELGTESVKRWLFYKIKES